MNHFIMYRKRYKIYERADPQKHYLKNWRIVRYWAKAKHDLTTAELDMLLYLYGEKLFTREDCMNFGKLMSWDKERFGKLLKNGWLHKWRNNGPNQKALYEVTYKTRRFIDSLYKKLNGQEKISEEPRNNPIFKKRNSTDKIYQTAIKKFNEEVDDKED